MNVSQVPYIDPYLAFKRLKLNGYPVKLFLDSCGRGMYSIIAVGIVQELALKDDEDVFEKLRTFFNELSSRYRLENLPFGIYGYISYDANRFIENIESKQVDDIGMPDVHFFLPKITLIFDNLRKKLHVVSLSNTRLDFSFRELKNSFKVKLKGFNMEKDYFLHAVENVKEHIEKGDTFQVNLSQRIDLEVEGSSLLMYDKLRRINPSPFSFYMDLGGFKAVSCSPERLLKRVGRVVETRPIAGTRRRGRDELEDLKFKKELFLSEKERAEHVMLVDLERNDLGRVCSYGSVHVNELMVREDYSHVMHIVSNVRGRLDEKFDSIDLIKAMFPGGTITGAPKVETMRIISRLEPTKRALYTGSVGYIGFNDTMDLNIVIRTLLMRENRGFIQVGAGIVWDSKPEREYRETMHKAEALLEALGVES